MEESQFVSLFIPIVMFYLFFAFPDAFLDISLTLYGRLLSVLLIIYYTCINKYYGILVCLFVIFYYQMDSVEGMCKYNNNEMLTNTSNKLKQLTKNREKIRTLFFIIFSQKSLSK